VESKTLLIDIPRDLSTTCYPYIVTRKYIIRCSILLLTSSLKHFYKRINFLLKVYRPSLGGIVEHTARFIIVHNVKS